MGSFYSQPRGPEVDINLYGNAHSQGVRSGSAMPTTMQSIAEGIQTGLNTYQTIQKIDANNTIQQQREIALESARRTNQIEAENFGNTSETARLKANYDLEQIKIDAELQQQEKLLLDTIRTGDKQKYADLIQSGRVSAFLGQQGNQGIRDQAINETFGYWTPENQEGYINSYKARQRAAVPKADKEKVLENLNDTSKKVEEKFASVIQDKFGSDTKKFYQNVKAVPMESYEYMELEEPEIDEKGKYVPKLDDKGNVIPGQYNMTRVPNPLYQAGGKEYGNIPYKLVDANDSSVVYATGLSSNDISGINQGKLYLNQLTDNTADDSPVNQAALEEAKKKAQQEKAAQQSVGSEATPSPQTTPVPTSVTPPKDAFMNKGATPTPTPKSNKISNYAEEARNRASGASSNFKVSNSSYMDMSPTITTPAGSVAYSVPVSANSLPVSKDTAEAKLANMTQSPVTVNFNLDKSISKDMPNFIETINNLPGSERMSTLQKAIIAVESRGNPRAGSEKQAKGLMQLMDGTAKEMGLTGDQVYDPELNAQAGMAYYEKQNSRIAERLSSINKAIDKGLSEQSYVFQTDPRITLLAYNGGPSYVLNAISKGYTEYNQIAEYVASQKSAKNAKENLEYPNKVLTAALGFLQGGNIADDKLLLTLNQYNIIDILDPSGFVMPEIQDNNGVIEETVTTTVDV